MIEPTPTRRPPPSHEQLEAARLLLAIAGRVDDESPIAPVFRPRREAARREDNDDVE